MKHGIFIFLLTALIGCTISSQKRSNTDKDSLKTDQILSSDDNALTINENCVVFLWPDSIEIAKMQSENDEESFNSIIDDLTYYLGTAAMICDSLNIKNYRFDKENIVFKNSNNKIITFKRKELKGDMVLFSLKKDPKIEYSISFNKDSVLNYFGR